jgi:hypothetical protein
MRRAERDGQTKSGNVKHKQTPVQNMLFALLQILVGAGNISLRVESEHRRIMHGAQT